MRVVQWKINILDQPASKFGQSAAVALMATSSVGVSGSPSDVKLNNGTRDTYISTHAPHQLFFIGLSHYLSILVGTGIVKIGMLYTCWPPAISAISPPSPQLLAILRETCLEEG